AAMVGVEPQPLPPEPNPPKIPLSALYDGEIEAAVKDIYQRDYMTFGYGPWPGAEGLAAKELSRSA
ncbi:MAG: hypothetical protein AAF576_09530, partial [Pseudomonadota bacterium]